ncbi:unnamed protein product [Cuscuta campestris]|uniref:GAG-pre-integrase domain-containing protein n=1 Tax=Cuscuta campestris TaxID=132261 RepID=A0A484K6P9_9ASTE|nr:unnamed protein product [Cuscuta campestris]
MGNDAVAEVVGIGDVCLETQMGTKLLLKDVRYAPDVRLNLISVHRLDDEGYENHFGGGKWKLKRGNLVVARGKKESKLYRLESVLSGDVKELEKCYHCLAGKQTRISLKKHSSSRRAELLELVHSDVCGPLKAFVHVPKNERSKLDAKTRQCIFLGYGGDEFGYRLYDPVEKKLVRSRDVVFMENQTIEDIDKARRANPTDSYELIDVEPRAENERESRKIEREKEAVHFSDLCAQRFSD